jgi:hypothetical protein
VQVRDDEEIACKEGGAVRDGLEVHGASTGRVPKSLAVSSFARRYTMIVSHPEDVQSAGPGATLFAKEVRGRGLRLTDPLSRQYRDTKTE